MEETLRISIIRTEDMFVNKEDALKTFDGHLARRISPDAINWLWLAWWYFRHCTNIDPMTVEEDSLEKVGDALKYFYKEMLKNA